VGNHEGAGAATYPGGWSAEYSSPDKLITLIVDEEDYDFHIVARPGHKPSAMRTVLDVAKSRGLEVLDEDEMDPEILEDGSIRIYLAPVELYAVVPVKAKCSTGKRIALGFGLAASVSIAFLIPSPLAHGPASTAEKSPANVEPISSVVPAVSNSN
jgi:hypothetical protein